ncbi:hypothetical protein KQI61_19135 [Anaerocolumna aminovalerica]|uniref:hypothetical protein n=1 Tax=Anaerocolumna aminovalerica TaxID=1527 RepID=UPI001C0F1EC1|nr:hypothetical protein [Anaerocolumna aminovalerica]MBU5334298.1 hypothetical protein [Anaerocolumna aminovalerica]
MKKVISLVMAVVIFLGLFTGYKTVYAATSDLSDYEKEILNAYLQTIWYGQNRWINIYSYDGIEYDFKSCKEEKLNFDYSWEVLTSPDESVNTRFIYTSYNKGYYVLKKMDYLAIDGLLVLRTSIGGNNFDVGVAHLPEITIYRVTLGIYIKEIDGKLYAYGEKYKFKDITEKNIVIPEELTEEEYINFATWVQWEWQDSRIKMENMYGLENPPLRKFTYADLFFIPITEGSMDNRRYFPVEYADGHILIRWYAN